MGLPAETVKLLQATAVEAAGVKLVRVDGIPDCAWLYLVGENAVPLTIPPKPRNFWVRTLASFLEAVRHWSEQFIGRPGSVESATIWYAPGQLLFLMDDYYRRDWARLLFAPSQQFRALTSLTPENGAACAFKQRDLLRFLRVALAGALESGVLATFQALEFARANDGSAMIQHGKESLGRRVEVTVNAGRPAPPEWIDANVLVYDLPDCKRRYTVRLDVEIDLQAETFTLRPLPDQTRRAQDEFMDDLAADVRRALAETHPRLPVLAGMPE